MAARLLPPNASELERLAAEALAQLASVPVPLRQLWNPDTCPVALLPYLAWAFSVDRWSQEWPESAKRAAIRSAYFIHSHKGTIGSLRRVVEPLGYLIQVFEWWQLMPNGVPGTFSVEIETLNGGITEDIYIELEWFIEETKPVSRHLIGLDISLLTKLSSYSGVAVSDGDELDVFPWTQADIAVDVYSWAGVSEHIIDEMDVYPYD
jgi:phage tail P2-like protein